MSVMTATNYAQENQEQFLEDLFRLLSQPSISTIDCGIGECTELVVELCEEYGFTETNVIETQGHPSVIARAYVDDDPDNDHPTILFYGHYDVQPVDKSQWTTDPFEPVIKTDSEGIERIYARGSGDNKGQWFAHLCAVHAIKQTHNLPVNVTLIVEGEEENLSPNFREVIKENKNHLESNLAIMADGPIDSSWRPHVILGVRGVLSVELVTEGPNKDLHAGNYGGPIPNPAMEIIKIVESMYDKNYQITIDGFYNDIAELSELDREVLGNMPDDSINVKSDLGLKQFVEPHSDSFMENLVYHPAFNISGLESGYTEEGVKTVLPASATAKIDFRLVPNQHPEKIMNLLEKHISQHSSDNVDIKIKKLGSMVPHRTALDCPYIDFILESVRDAWEVDPILRPVLGASAPIYELGENLDIPVMLIPYANPDENNHAPDENLTMNCFKNGIKTSIQIIENFPQNDLN